MTHERTSGVYDTPGGRQVTMAYRTDTNDHNTLWATLNEDEYRLPSGLSGTAFDIGGYLGSVGIALAVDNPGLSVVIVEPVPDNCALIRDNIAANGVGDRVRLVEGAAGRGGETVEVWFGFRGSTALEHHAYVGNSTLAYETTPAEHDSVTYDAVGLAELVDFYGAPSFVKIDTEGAEWAFLDSPAVKDVPLIVGEWHPVRGHTLWDLMSLLEGSHDVTFTGPQAGPGGFRAVAR